MTIPNRLHIRLVELEEQLAAEVEALEATYAAVAELRLDGATDALEQAERALMRWIGKLEAVAPFLPADAARLLGMTWSARGQEELDTELGKATGSAELREEASSELERVTAGPKRDVRVLAAKLDCQRDRDRRSGELHVIQEAIEQAGGQWGNIEECARRGGDVSDDSGEYRETLIRVGRLLAESMDERRDLRIRIASLTLSDSRTRGGAAGQVGEAQRSQEGAPRSDHAPDFSWLTANGVRHEFTGQQRHVIRVLWEQRQSGGEGAPLSVDSIAEAIDPEAVRERFKMGDVFRGHSAYGSILRKAGKGAYGLFLDPP